MSGSWIYLVGERLTELVQADRPGTYNQPAISASSDTFQIERISSQMCPPLTADMKVNLTKSLGQRRSGSIILHPCPLDELIQVFVLRGGDVLR